MNLPRRLARVLFPALALAIMTPLQAADDSAKSRSAPKAETQGGKLIPLSEKDPAWAKKAKAEYPMTTCVVSGEGLSPDPEEAMDFVYRAAGAADRLVSFCCEGCSKDFEQEPQRFIQKLDEAAAAKR